MGTDFPVAVYAELERLRARVDKLERDARDVVAAYEAGYGTKDEILALRATLGEPVDR